MPIRKSDIAKIEKAVDLLPPSYHFQWRKKNGFIHEKYGYLFQLNRPRKVMVPEDEEEAVPPTQPIIVEGGEQADESNGKKISPPDLECFLFKNEMFMSHIMIDEKFKEYTKDLFKRTTLLSDWTHSINNTCSNFGLGRDDPPYLQKILFQDMTMEQIFALREKILTSKEKELSLEKENQLLKLELEALEIQSFANKVVVESQGQGCLLEDQTPVETNLMVSYQIGDSVSVAAGTDNESFASVGVKTVTDNESFASSGISFSTHIQKVELEPVAIADGDYNMGESVPSSSSVEPSLWERISGFLCCCIGDSQEKSEDGPQCNCVQ